MADTRSLPVGPESPLSVGQQALWTLHRLDPDSAAYHGASAGRIRPVPDAATLARAVHAVVDRHELLRSVYAGSGAGPRRTVRDPGLVRLREQDASGADEAALHRLIRQLARRPYRLAETGACRVVLLRRADEAVLLVGTHQIAADTTSHGVIWRDLVHAYEAYTAGREPRWADHPARYDDYVAREARLIDSPRGARMAGYWRRVRAGAVAVELPTDRARPVWPAFRGATRSQRLPYRLVARLRAAAAGSGVSPFAFLVGVFQALLFRYTAQEDFAITCPATSRRGAFHAVVGHFVNPLILRARIDRTTTLAGAVRSAGEQVRQGIANAAHPNRAMAGGSGGPPGPPLRIGVTLVTPDRLGSLLDRTLDGEVVEVAGLRLRQVDVPHLEGGCDLSLQVTQGGTSVSVAFRYDTDLFDAGTVERLVGQYTHLVALAVADPELAVARVPLRGDAERRLLAVGADAGGSRQERG